MAEARTQALMKKAVVREAEESVVSRIEEMESRMQVMEEIIAKQNDKINKNIADMLEAIRLLSVNRGVASTSENPNSGRALPAISSPPIINSDSERVQSGLMGIRKKIWEWMYKVDQIFAIDNTPEELKVRMASFHFDNVAATWYQTIVQSDLGKSINQDWSTFKMLMKKRFEDLLDDAMVELKRLQETDGILEYHEQFESIITRVNLPQEYLVSLYLAGLRTDTQMNIRMFQPHSMTECLRLGRLYEEAHPRPVINSGWSNHSNVKGTNNAMGLSQVKKNSELKGETQMQMQGDSPKTVPNKRWKVLSAEEISEHDAKGLCYVCGEKYTPEHDLKHKNTQFFVVETEKEREELLRNF